MTQQSLTASRKLHPRFTPVVFAFYMSGIMAFLICMVVTAANRLQRPVFLAGAQRL